VRGTLNTLSESSVLLNGDSKAIFEEIVSQRAE